MNSRDLILSTFAFCAIATANTIALDSNCWCFDSRKWNGRADAPGLILRALRRNESGDSRVA